MKRDDRLRTIGCAVVLLPWVLILLVSLSGCSPYPAMTPYQLTAVEKACIAVGGQFSYGQYSAACRPVDIRP